MWMPLVLVVLALAGGVANAGGLPQRVDAREPANAGASNRKMPADYPPVGVLQDQLHAHPGDAIARLIPYRGRLLQPRYLSSRHDGGGVYTVRIKLDEQR